MEKLKVVDASSLPPCKTTLIEKIKCANFVSSVWKRANTANPMLFSPEGHGWCIENSAYKLIWFSGNQMPQTMHDQLVSKTIQEEPPTDSDSPPSETDSESESDTE